MIKVAYAPIYKYDLPTGHRFPMEKYELLPQQLIYEGTLVEHHFFQPERLPQEILLQTHASEYVDQLFNGTLPTRAARRIGFPLRSDLIERGLFIAQGTIDCAKWALEHGAALNIAGGTHHAYADHGEGFCVFNDFAIAANYLLATGMVERILIVDLDVHQGNGTAHLFNHDKRVFTFSMHGAKNYPLRKEQSDLDISLPDHTLDHTYLSILESTLAKLIKTHQPELILYLAGADVIADDVLGRLDLSIEGAKQRDRIVFEQCYLHEIPVAVTMGGGYATRIRDIIEVHANTFRLAADIFE